MWSVDNKGKLGLDTSLTDIWARALSYHILSGLGLAADTETTTDNFFNNDTSHGAGLLWSNIPNIPSYSDFSLPLPIVVACVKPNNFSELHPNTPLFLNTTQYEFTPYEMGSFDPNLSSFLDVRYLGTHVNAGNPPNSTACVTEFDQASFVFGTSSSLFDVRYLYFSV
jgi:lysophospholipase